MSSGSSECGFALTVCGYAAFRIFRSSETPYHAIFYSGLNLNQDKATKPKTVQIVRQGEATPYWFKVNPLYLSVCHESA